MRTSTHPQLRGALAVLACGAWTFGCAGRPAEVSPAEIPQLEQRLAGSPNDAQTLLRYAAALYASERCDSARVVARAGMALRPGDALGPLVLGGCFERAAEYDQAVAVYQNYLTTYPDARGSSAVRAREMLALRARATRDARLALQRESELAQQPGDIATIAVLPIAIVGDSQYAPLARGLAQMIISDLNLLQRFRLVERLQIGALLEELRLAQTQRVDPGTAARVGNLLRAGRMVQGLAQIPDEANVRLEASVVQATGEVTAAAPQTGRLRDLLTLEKQVVLDIVGQLGYQVSEAERQRILENGTQNLTAFLAYSRGLVAEDLGDYAAAAQHFSTAVQSDPGFQAARQGYQAATAAPRVQQAAPAQVTAVAAEPPPPPPDQITTGDATGGAVTSSVTDLASTQGEQATATSQQQQTTQQAGQTNTSAPPPTTTTTKPPETATGIVRIVFRLP